MERRATDQSLRKKELIVFDLDGTLAESKSAMDAEMASLLKDLLHKKKVAVISGGRFSQFQKQFLASLRCPPSLLEKLFLFPTSSTTFYRFQEGEWRQVYAESLTEDEKQKIRRAFAEAFRRTSYRQPAKIYGEVIEDRGTQITFSALGQEAPVAEKKKWNSKHDVRDALMEVLRAQLPEFEVRSGGLTSIDVTRKGIDKAYGIRQIVRHTGIPLEQMLFVGDAIYPGGNDYAAVRTGIDYVRVAGPEETKAFIRAILGREEN